LARELISIHTTRELPYLIATYLSFIVSCIGFLTIASIIIYMVLRRYPRYSLLPPSVVVREIRLDDPSRDVSKYNGLHFVGKKDKNFIFFGYNEPTVHIVNEDYVKEMVLEQKSD
jgi:hypothetical protein